MENKTGSLNQEDLSILFVATGDDVEGIISFNGGDAITLEPNIEYPVEPAVLVPEFSEGNFPLVSTNATGGASWERYIYYRVEEDVRQYFESTSPSGIPASRITTSVQGSVFLTLDLMAVAGPTIVIGTVIIDIEQE